MNGKSREEIATWLHGSFCHLNHIDYCGWDYDEVKQYKWYTASHSGWLKKADKLIEFLKPV